ATGGFVQEEDATSCVQPAADDGLLLVASAEVDDRAVGPGRLDRQTVDEVTSEGRHARRKNGSGSGGPAEPGHDHVLGDTEEGDHTFFLAVLGGDPHAQAPHGAGVEVCHRGYVHLHGAL